METKKQRKIMMAREVGFCFGVKRAINLTKQALDDREDVFILGDLVHNKRVTDELEGRGLQKMDDYGEKIGGTMVIRAHGLPKIKLQEARDRGFEVVDATCPIVLRAQEAAQMLERDGYQVVIIGDKNHAEVKGIIGALDDPALVIGTIAELHEARDNYTLLRKIGVLFQTTLALEMCFPIVNAMMAICKEVRVINTICRPVQNRQEDAIEIAQKVELMIVVGSRTSANTVELAGICRHYNPNTVHVQNADELPYEKFGDCELIGLASGLSTPEDLVEAVRVKVLTMNASEAEPESEMKPVLQTAGV